MKTVICCGAIKEGQSQDFQLEGKHINRITGGIEMK